MVEKQKLHLLTHLRVWFRPLVGVSTEAFECFNAIFWFCSIYSNHLTPSHNISHQLTSQESLKHWVTGGWWWLDPKKMLGCKLDLLCVTSCTCNPCSRVCLCGIIPSHSQKVSHFSISYPLTLLSTFLLAGKVKLQAMKKIHGKQVHEQVALCDTLAPHAVNYGSYTSNVQYLKGCELVAQCLDECWVQFWVFMHSPISVS